MIKEKFAGSTGKKSHPRRALAILGPAIALSAALLPAVSKAQTGGLGFLPGGSFSYSLAISGNAFAVVGQSGATGYNAGAPYPYGGEAALWNLPNSKSVQGLGALSGGSWSYATATNYGSNNTSGSVVVGASDETNATLYGKAFIWTAATGMEDLGLLSGGSFANAFGVNADATSTLDAVVVGQADSTNYELGEAFIWQAGSMHELGALSGYQSSTAFGISADGSVVVGYSRAADGWASEPFRWTQTSGMVGLGWLTGGNGAGISTYNVAQATNSDGTVIVGAAASTAYPDGEAYSWTCTTGSCTGGTMAALGVLPGGTSSEALAVSADGSVVVGESSSTAFPGGEAFIWTASIGMQSLQNYLSNAAFVGWQLLAATGVSADGTVINGIGYDPNDNPVAWVAYLGAGGTGGCKASHDFNSDCTSDILWRNSGSGQLAMWLMSNGQLSSGATVSTVPSVWSVVGTRDFNGDGDADILWKDTSGDVAIWLMNGATLGSGKSLGNIGTQWAVAGTGDFNDDGTGDVLWRNTSTGDAAIWLMSNGAFSSGVNLGVLPSAWQVAGTGDFNGDGTTDILWRNQSTGDLAVWLMQNGQFASGADLGTVSLTWTVVGTGDFNGDGTSDILWRDTSGDLAIWLISNGQFSSGASLGQVPITWSVSETGDFNGDGTSDILWLDQSGNAAVWLINAASLSSGIGLGNVGASWQVQGQNAD